MTARSKIHGVLRCVLVIRVDAAGVAVQRHCRAGFTRLLPEDQAASRVQENPRRLPVHQEEVARQLPHEREIQPRKALPRQNARAAQQHRVVRRAEPPKQNHVDRPRRVRRDAQEGRERPRRQREKTGVCGSPRRHQKGFDGLQDRPSVADLETRVNIED